MRVIKSSRILALAVTLFAIAGLARANSGNETIATATPLNWSSANYASASGIIGGYDVDFYQFQVYQGGTVTFSLQPGYTLISPRIDLYDTSGSSFPIAGMAGSSLDKSLTPGIYYPRISSGTNDPGGYLLIVTSATAGTPGAAQIGSVIDPAPEPSAVTALGIGLAVLGAAVMMKRRGKRAPDA